MIYQATKRHGQNLNNIAKGKSNSEKDTWFQFHDTLENRKLCRYQWLLGILELEGWLDETDFQGNETILYSSIVVYTWHNTFVRTHRTIQHRVNLNSNCGLWLIVMYYYWFINCNK
jgi:hypothetical protein